MKYFAYPVVVIEPSILLLLSLAGAAISSRVRVILHSSYAHAMR